MSWNLYVAAMTLSALGCTTCAAQPGLVPVLEQQPTVVVQPRPGVILKPPITMEEICPTRVAPFFPRAAMRQGISGRVEVRAKLVNGVVAEILAISGPKVFHPSVAAALSQYKCTVWETPVVVAQTFTFSLEAEPATPAASQASR